MPGDRSSSRSPASPSASARSSPTTHIDLDLRRGEILALLGENGAGKTTLMNILFGHYVPMRDEVRVAARTACSRRCRRGSPGAALAAGIGMVHQHFTLAENLTGLDNIRARHRAALAGSAGDTARARRKVEAIIAESGLDGRSRPSRSRALTVGEKQRVEILKALYRDARVLILDEPTAVLTPQEAEGLFVMLRRSPRAGSPSSSSRTSWARCSPSPTASSCCAAAEGRRDSPTRDADRRAIADLMVGTRRGRRAGARRVEPGAVLLELDGVSRRRARRAQVARAMSASRSASGEIVGIAGVSGNGQAAHCGADRRACRARQRRAAASSASR